MSRILAYTSPAKGHLFPAAAILEVLRNRGHLISVRTLSSECALMESRGLRAQPIDPVIEAIEHSDWQARNPREGLRKAVEVFAARAEHDAADLRRAIDADRPDAMLIDINSWGALAAAEAWGGPWAAYCPYPVFLSSPEAPPFGPGLPPGHGPLGRLRDWLLRPLVVGTVERSFLPALNRVRAAVGVSPLTRADEMFLKPPLLIYMTAEPFEYHHRDWPESLVMVGPCEWEPPEEVPTWVAALDRNLVLVTTSSEFQNDGRLIQAALDAPGGGAVHRRCDSARRRFLVFPHPGQRARGGLALARPPAGALALRHHPRRYGSHPEGAGARRSSLCRAIRAGSDGGSPAG